MKPKDFCYWLQGLLESRELTSLDEEKTQMIREHLDLVFSKVTGKMICADGPPFDAGESKSNPTRLRKELEALRSNTGLNTHLNRLYC